MRKLPNGISNYEKIIEENRIYVDKKYMYPDIIRGINLLKKYNIEFGIFMVACKETIHKAKDMILELDEKYLYETDLVNA